MRKASVQLGKLKLAAKLSHVRCARLLERLDARVEELTHDLRFVVQEERRARPEEDEAQHG